MCVDVHSACPHWIFYSFIFCSNWLRAYLLLCVSSSSEFRIPSFCVRLIDLIWCGSPRQDALSGSSISKCVFFVVWPNNGTVRCGSSSSSVWKWYDLLFHYWSHGWYSPDSLLLPDGVWLRIATAPPPLNVDDDDQFYDDVDGLWVMTKPTGRWDGLGFRRDR